MQPSMKWKEQIAPNEAARFECYAREFVKMQKGKSQEFGKGRALHRKQIIALRATFDVLPDLLNQRGTASSPRLGGMTPGFACRTAAPTALLMSNRIFADLPSKYFAFRAFCDRFAGHCKPGRFANKPQRLRVRQERRVRRSDAGDDQGRWRFAEAFVETLRTARWHRFVRPARSHRCQTVRKLCLRNLLQCGPHRLRALCCPITVDSGRRSAPDGVYAGLGARPQESSYTCAAHVRLSTAIFLE